MAECNKNKNNFYKRLTEFQQQECNNSQFSPSQVKEQNYEVEMKKVSFLCKLFS